MISTGVVTQVSPLKVTLDGATSAVGAKAIYSPALADRVVVLQYGRLLLALPTTAITGGGGGSGLTSFQGRTTAAAVLTKADVIGTGLAASDVAALAKASNLSDLASAATARTNLGLGTAATQASSAFDAAGAASSAVATETTRAEAAEGLLVTQVATPDTAWRNVGASGQPAYQNGWSTSVTTPAHNLGGFFRDALGFVTLRGRLQAGTISYSSTGTCFQLPAGYRPLNMLTINALASAHAVAELDIQSDGSIWVASGTAGGWVSLENVRFMAEQ